MDAALYRSTDKGEKWEKLGDVKDARYGPIFGKDAKQLFVLTKDGVVESARRRDDLVEAARAAEGVERHLAADVAWSTIRRATRLYLT